MPTQISTSVFSHSGTPLLAGSSLERILGESNLSVLPSTPIPSKPLHAILGNSLDLSDSEVRRQIADLLQVLCDRLNLMPEMAELNTILGKKPFDPTQEERVLQKAVSEGKLLGLPETLIRPFMQRQMDIAKDIQKAIMSTIQLPSNGYAQADIDEAGREKQKLRDNIEKKLKPLLKALKPLTENLSSPGVQNEIARQLNRNLLTDKCAKLQTKQWIKESLKKLVLLSG